MLGASPGQSWQAGVRGQCLACGGHGCQNAKASANSMRAVTRNLGSESLACFLSALLSCFCYSFFVILLFFVNNIYLQTCVVFT